MGAVKHKHNHSDYDLYDDIAKIRSAFADASYDLKGKAGEILSQSVDTVKEQSAQMKDNVVDYTAENPFKSLGIALATGIALGYFLRFRRK
jgi:ElaB/YqjD/DUF883 family membrane-anchored ribosome-binding protein